MPARHGRHCVVSIAIMAWFFMATVDYETVWVWGPYTTRAECEVDLEQVVPAEVETTGCKLMAISQEGMEW